jgi:hypothetical protein
MLCFFSSEVRFHILAIVIAEVRLPHRAMVYPAKAGCDATKFHSYSTARLKK